jgi:trans-2,3-dihydro-3-hydroxyanthranilate isomerase
VADDDHGLAAAGSCGLHALGGRSGREALVGLGLQARGTGELGAGLSSAEERARQDGVGANPLRGKSLAQVAGGASAVRGESPQLVRLSVRSLGMANQVELHGWENSHVRTLRYVVADVFTDTPLAGNPVAVFTDAREVESDEMQRLAREMNLSESVFVLPREGDGHARIRIFTPSAELPFAGHPTLGTAFVLGQPMQLDVIRLETGMGVVPVALEREGDRLVFGRMTQPIPTREPFAEEEVLLAAVGVERSELPVEIYDNGARHVYVALGSEEAVAALQPDFRALSALPAVLGTNCFAGSGSRWKTRMFAPGGGVAEDPATGSAAGPLALHLARHGRIAFGEEIEISQGAEIGRPSTLYARADGSAEQVERVEVGGSAVVVARGEFRLPE